MGWGLPSLSPCQPGAPTRAGQSRATGHASAGLPSLPLLLPVAQTVGAVIASPEEVSGGFLLLISPALLSHF